MLRSALLVTIGIFFTALTSLFVVVFYPAFPHGEFTVNRVSRIWAKLLLKISNVTGDVIGAGNVLTDRPQIFMANHQSGFDILIVRAFLPGQMRWIAKKELFKIPVFGAALRRTGAVEIDRQNRTKAIISLEDAARQIREGKSVMTFPEGTRSRNGQVKKFKKGVFYLALAAGVPIVPISIVGSGEIMPKRSLRIQPGRIKMIIGKPVEVSNYSKENIDELITTVRDTIVSNYNAFRNQDS